MARKNDEQPPSTHEPSVYGATQMDYQDYLKVPELLALQRPQSTPAHHDEMLFIIIHQAYELWFKLLVHETEMTLRHLKKAGVARAQHHVSRIVAVMQLLIQQIHLLETMKPIDFLQFRDHLKPASGFQSRQFREFEFLAGLKEPAYLKFFESRPELVARLQERLKGPDLGVAFCDMVRTMGYAVPKGVTNESLRNDPATITAVARALAPLYQRPDSDMGLYLLCEKLLELDESFSLWRTHHVHVVERIIGSKTGTGGSSGVPYLRTTTAKRAFPFLWEIRTLLEVPGTPVSVDEEKKGEKKGKGEKRSRRG